MNWTCNNQQLKINQAGSMDCESLKMLSFSFCLKRKHNPSVVLGLKLLGDRSSRKLLKLDKTVVGLIGIEYFWIGSEAGLSESMLFLPQVCLVLQTAFSDHTDFRRCLQRGQMCG